MKHQTPNNAYTKLVWVPILSYKGSKEIKDDDK